MHHDDVQGENFVCQNQTLCRQVLQYSESDADLVFLSKLIFLEKHT